MEQEHHGKLMFIVIGLIAVVVIIFGVMMVIGRNKAKAPVSETPNTAVPEDFDRATAATNENLLTEVEIQELNDATGVSGGASAGMSRSEIDAMNRATSAQ